MQVDIVLKSLFERSLAANTIVVSIPVPPQTAKVHIKKSKGDAKYDGSAGIVRWTIPKFSGQKQHSLSADVTLVSTTREKKAWSRYVSHSFPCRVDHCAVTCVASPKYRGVVNTARMGIQEHL
jgi:Adaptor complexes medium subunit family